MALQAASRPGEAVRYEGQLLGDGRDGPVWSVHGDSLRPDRGPRRRAPCQHGRAGRPRDLEPRLHTVQQVGPVD